LFLLKRLGLFGHLLQLLRLGVGRFIMTAEPDILRFSHLLLDPRHVSFSAINITTTTLTATITRRTRRNPRLC
jgi:hypothetical protein